jgi:predicted nucleotidyltransferase
MAEVLRIEKRHLEIMMKILTAYVEKNQVWVFGSRSGGSPKPHSDVDLVIIDPPLVSEKTLSSIKLELEDSDLPFRVDVSIWSQLSGHLQKSIETKHAILYQPL